MKSGSIVGKIMFGLLLAGIIVSLPDIKRYIRISTM
jgi:hypothetical protein